MHSTQECSTGIQCASTEDTTPALSTSTSSTLEITKKADQHSVTDNPDEDLDEEVASEEDLEESLHQMRYSTTQQDFPKHTTPEQPPTPGEPSEIRMQRDDSRAYLNYYGNQREVNHYGHQIYYPHQALPKPEKLVDQRVPSEAT